MNHDPFSKVYPITRNDHGIYTLQKEMDPELEIQYLAQHPKTQELFLLLSDCIESMVVLRGTETDGLRICKPLRIEDAVDCLAIYFEQDGIVGCITTISHSGCFGPMLYPLNTCKPTALEIVPLHIMQPYC
jgi:hypothetical protein